jgi:hypothetical protein
MKNFGKGPALKAFSSVGISLHTDLDNHVQSQCNLIFPFVGLKPSWPVATSDEGIYKHQWGQLIFPDGTSSEGSFYSDDSDDLIGQEVYIVGCIVYRDQFNDPHWTKFCYNTGDFAVDIVKNAASPFFFSNSAQRA